MADIDPDVRWMSYAEAARTLRVTPESLHRRMRRNGWARREGNDGKPRVAVPIDALRRFDPVPDVVQDGVLGSVPDERDRTIAALEAEAAVLRDALGRERDRADQAEARAGQAEQRADQTEAERDAARAEREAAKVAAAGAEGEAKGLRLALEEARRPFWRRWLD